MTTRRMFRGIGPRMESTCLRSAGRAPLSIAPGVVVERVELGGVIDSDRDLELVG
jgi:hypothetical protein